MDFCLDRMVPGGGDFQEELTLGHSIGGQQ